MMRLLSITVSCAAAIVALLSTAGSAQQKVPFRGDTPIAPQGIPKIPLPDQPVVFDTAEGQKIRVVVHASGLSHPWSLAFLPDPSTPPGASGTMLVTERDGRLRVIRKGVLDPKPVDGVPTIRRAGLSGLMDVVLHPHYATNNFVYLSYAKPLSEKETATAIARGKWNGTALTEVTDVFVAPAGVGGGARMAFGRDGTLYVTTGGGGGNSPQDPNGLGGKVLRLKDDGTVPMDNPFVGKPGHRPEIFTMGHRSSLGLAVHPGTGEVWQNENGPNGGDEINILKPGANYGWPIVSLGRVYSGPWQSPSAVFFREGFEQPVVYWTPAIAVSGMAFYTGDRLPKWKGDVFVGSLREGEIPGTGHLERILFNEKMEELRRESLLQPLRQRIRDVRQGPDGLLYLLTDEDNGAVLRIEPAE
jgi:glucose/arabinose dehydrogenase